jgi:hypothetical protein
MVEIPDNSHQMLIMAVVTYTIFQEMIFFGLTGLDTYDPVTKVCQH